MALYVRCQSHFRRGPSFSLEISSKEADPNIQNEPSFIVSYQRLSTFADQAKCGNFCRAFRPG